MNKSSRALAKTWPYPRHRHFEKAMRETASSWFKSKGLETSSKYSFILADRNEWHKNIILPEVAAYIEAEKEKNEAQNKNYPLHRYIHHGLSSQAMLFNLIGPLIVRNDLEPLKHVLENSDLVWPTGEIFAGFEYEDRSVFNEDTGQPTSIDLVIGERNKKPLIFIEAKLVEKEFGGCSVFSGGDCDGANPVQQFGRCYLHHIGRKYWELMEKHGFLKGPVGDGIVCIMASYYQFLREVLMALEMGGVFVLLCDERSPTFYLEGINENPRGLMPFLMSITPQELHPRIKRITIQQIAVAIRKTGRHAWISDFEKKYGLV